jgi:hypothetical protein
MAARAFTVVCAWCHRIIAVAPTDDGVTHTICASCFDWTLTHPASQIGAEPIDPALGEHQPPRGYFGDDV